MSEEVHTIDGRKALSRARRIVVKIGSRSLMADKQRFAQLADEIVALRKDGRQVVLVSSGAVALGRERLALTERPKEISLLQATAAAGQSLLMRRWEDSFEKHGVHVGQVLLTHALFSERETYLNARQTIETLLLLGEVPIINENDAIATEELRFGDNDELASLTASLVGAELLVILSDVEGLLDPQNVRASVVKNIEQAQKWVRPQADDVGLGGMGSKLRAARTAVAAGVATVIAPATEAQGIQALIKGADLGTLFVPHSSPIASRKHWIAFTLKPKGQLVIDAGAVTALREDTRSLLAAGLVEVRGEFAAGDAVSIVDEAGYEIGRGLVRSDDSECAALIEKRAQARQGGAEALRGAVVVHRDDLVIFGAEAQTQE